MKLAELCTAYPERAGTAEVRHPGAAIPHILRLRLRSQRGYLQAALDYHPQRSPSRLGLGLRPYESGDSLRALALRPLLLQEQLLTRTDVSPGRFHVTVIVHSYANMNFKSNPESPSKHQLAWATAGLLQNVHEQQAQKVDILTLSGANLSEQMLRHAGRIKRSHFCYLITDLLFNPSDLNASARDIAAALSNLQLRHGMVIVTRDKLESPDQKFSNSDEIFLFDAPEDHLREISPENSFERHSGSGYIGNLKAQLADLQQQLNTVGWSSLLTTADDELDQLTRGLSLRLAGQRI